MATPEIRPLLKDANLEDAIDAINRVFMILAGKVGGHISLLADDGISHNVRGGAQIATGLFALKIRSGAGFHLDVRDSTDLASRLRVTDAMVLMSVNELQIIGTTPRITSDLSNATLANRLAFQSYIVNGNSTLTVLPNGTATTSGFSAYNNAAPGSATVGATMQATSTAMEFRAESPGASYKPMDFYTNGTKQISISTAGVVGLTTALAIGATPSTTGAVRLASAGAVLARNNGNSADLNVVVTDASDNLILGAASGSAASYLLGTTAVVLQVGAAVHLTATTTTLTLGAAGDTVTTTTVDPPVATTQVTAGSQIKAFGFVTAGGGATVGQSYNLTSVVRNAAGDFSVTINRDFTAATYAVVVTVQDNGLNLIARVNGQAAGSFDVHFRDLLGVLTDPDGFSFLCAGVLS